MAALSVISDLSAKTFVIEHMGVVIARAVIAFVLVRDSPGGTTAYLAVVSNSSNLVKWALYVTQTLVGDLCMVSESAAWKSDS
jgi:hypothetical protein